MHKSALFLVLLTATAHAATTHQAIPPSDIPANFVPVKPDRDFALPRCRASQ